jgi:O-antigen ligase
MFGLLIVSAPFEATQPLVRVPMQEVSNLEVMLGLTLMTSAFAFVAGAGVARWHDTLTVPWLALCVAALMAAVLAPEHRGNAVHMSIRLLLAGAVYVVTILTIDGRARIERALHLLLATGVIVSALAILEYLEVPGVLAGLRVFRPSVALIGAQVRAAGPLQYPTIASMCLEISFACGLGLMARARIDGRGRDVLLLFLALAVICEGIVVTFTRSGLITAALSIMIVAALAASRAGRQGLAPFALLACVGVAAVAVSRSNEVIGARLASEGQDGWYRAQIDAPATLSLAPGQTAAVPIRLTNRGRITWAPDAPQPFRVSYHWLEAGSARVVEWEGHRTLLPAPVPPEETVAIEATVTAPPMPGDYRLIWDIEQVDRLWFSTEPDAQLVETRAAIAGVAVGTRRRGGPLFMPTRAVRPGRRVLWGAAAGMLADRPVTGVGPDNFRLRYGQYAHLPGADDRVHSNNTYVELIAGTGALGALALLWVGRGLIRTAFAAIHSRDPLAIGLAAAVAAIAVHGLADSFLSFTPTYIVMAVTVGLLTCAARSGGVHADRV